MVDELDEAMETGLGLPAELVDDDLVDELGEDHAAPDAPTRLAAEAIELDESQLVACMARVVRQDEAAFELLYKALASRVYSTALHITRQAALAEEVTENTFWQVWCQAPRFEAARGSVKAWVLTMARSRALDALRARQRDPAQGKAQALDDDELPADDVATDPMDLLSAAQRGSRLHAALAALDPLRRQLISLAFFRGLTQDEIAADTGLPLGTVKSHLRRSLALLRQTLGTEFATGEVS